MRSPDVYPSGTAERPRTGFLSVLRRAPYETVITDLDTIVERMNDDAGILGSCTLTLWERGEKAVTNVEVRQRPTESYARINWKTGRRHESSESDFLDERWWENATPVDWSAEHKQLYLLRVWQDVINGIDSAASAAAQAATA
jgi:hypothetical protein